MRLMRAMIRVLSENDDAHLIKRCEVKRAEPGASFGEDAFPLRFFFDQKGAQVLGQLRELLAVQSAKVRRRLDGVEKGISGHFYTEVRRDSQRPANDDGR